MYESLAVFIAGWFGSHRWFGDIYGVPNPKDPHPWEYLAMGAVGWRVQRVIATQLVVYPRVFRSPRFSEAAD